MSQPLAHLIRADEELEIARTRHASNGHRNGCEISTTPISPSSLESSIASPPRSHYQNGACSRVVAGEHNSPVVLEEKHAMPGVLRTPSDRHSIPIEATTTTTTSSHSRGERRRTIPGDSMFDNRHGLPNRTDAKKAAARARFNALGIGVPAEGGRPVHSTSTGNAHGPQSSLETILQGQELSVYSTTNWPHMDGPHAAATVPVHHASTGLDNWHVTGNLPVGPRQDWPNAGPPPCCACRAVDPSCDSPGHCEPYTAVSGNGSLSHLIKNPASLVARSVTTYKSDSRAQSLPGPQWAKELIGRFRIAPSPNHSVDHVTGKSLEPRHSQPTVPSRSSYDRGRPTADAMDCTPDSIDPRRLPKSHGPMSGCLEFAKSSRHQMSPAPGSSNPIPVGGGRHSRTNNGSPSGTASSWKSRKRAMKTRWFSQSNSVATDNFSGPSSYQARLSYSAVEEFQGAVDLLANRKQTTNLPSGMPPIRTSVRVKRASESDRFLVISKSPSDSREEIFPCALEHFDEHHMYNTLFRHSTCYDVLPDSGKLVILDSRLGIVRAIRALLENGVPVAPIWHSPTQRVAGMLSQDLALHLLASLLCYSGDGCSEDPLGGSDQPMPLNFSTRSASSIADGLRHWGTQHVQDVLRIFNSDPDKSRYAPSSFDSALIVSPQTPLKRALCRLIHSAHRTEHHFHASPDSSGDVSRSTGSGSSGSAGESRHAARRIPPLKSIRQMSDPGSSRGPGAAMPLPSPTHLVVMNPICGNVLGMLGVDRLLAYLRLRLNELPYSSQMLSPIGSTAGLRWTERHRLLKPQFAPASSRGPLSVDTECAFPPEPPLLRLTTLCRDALSTLAQWLPQLPALPVLTSTDGATAIVNQHGLIGLIAPGDLLHFFLDNCPDTAATQPLSKILEAKLAHCPFLYECVCYTYETLLDVLDRMFRLRTPCLVLFDAVPVHGMPVGMVTAKDLLCAIMETRPNAHHHHHSRHHSGQSHERSRRPSQNNDFPPESPMELFEDDLSAASSVDKSQPGAAPFSVPFVPSSGDSDDSSDSTCSAQSGSDRSAAAETTSSKPCCDCACHRNPAAAFIEPSSLHTPSPSAVVLPTTQASPSPHSQNVRFAVPSPVNRATYSMRPTLPSSPPALNPIGSGRRGDEDDALFPMD